MSPQQTRISAKKSSSIPIGPKYTPAPVLQPKATKKPDQQLPEWQPEGGGMVSPLQRLLDTNAVQAKLTIGEPNDKYEQEADTVAQDVVQRLHSPLSEAPPETAVQRETEAGKDKLQRKPILQRTHAVGGEPASADLEGAINRAKGGGQPLEAGLQRSMSQAMGADFSGVRVHTDSHADELNQSIQAKAFTTGQDVFFKQGAYQPGSRGGQELIAHELTHVVQQGGGQVQRKSHSSGENIGETTPAIAPITRSVANNVAQKKTSGTFSIQFVDNRPEAIAQRKLQEMANNSPQTQQTSQLQAIADNYSDQQQQPSQKKASEIAQLKDKSIFQSVVQRVKNKASGKEKFEEQMKAMNEMIEKANHKIKEIHKIKATFGTDSSTTPMNPAVFFKEIPTTDSLNISKTKARLANFSSMVKEFVNAQQKKSVTPEIQTALVKSSIDAAEAIYVSGNTSKGNKKMGVKKATVLGDYYRDKIRPISIYRRTRGLEKAAKSMFVTRKGTIVVKKGFKERLSITKEDDRQAIIKKVVRQLLKEHKKNPDRLSGTSSRKFAKAHSKKLLIVPKNTQNIHAESAILASLRDTKDKIQEIGGTKVACMACQAYFTRLGEESLLGDDTGYAWISKSSQQQIKLLIDSIESAEDYLIHLAKILESRLSSLKRYTGAAGEKRVEEADLESDVDMTDSEDEESLTDLEKSSAVNKIAEALAAH
ncbi:eCIS core domain-containing protein [Planktothricoides raciborskii]|uniref:eCIS core domain-containing protein n=1 Tax=Planktothricoides raciborskii TaxID=132608 RepID=UPI0018F0570D|nr:DUF4157 domain-containing protein [Planktothricoides raciborskii]